MRTKKTLAILLAFVLALGLSTAVYADSDVTVTATGTAPVTATVTLSSILAKPVMSVTIAPPATILANPYELSYQKQSDTVEAITAAASLIAPASLITNKSAVKIKITATPTATSSTGVKIMSSTAVGETSAAIFMSLHLGKLSGSDPATFNPTDAANVSTVVKETGSTPISVTLDKPTTANNDTAATHGAYQLTGDTGGAGAWTGKSVTLSIVFNIAPDMSA